MKLFSIIIHHCTAFSQYFFKMTFESCIKREINRVIFHLYPPLNGALLSMKMVQDKFVEMG